MKDVIAWPVCHASQENISDKVQPVLTQLLPLFYEKAATSAVFKHGIDMLKKVTNLGQILVILLDAPLFVSAKLVQWNRPYTHNIKDFVVKFGGLHIEIAILKTLGDYLESMRWTNKLVQIRYIPVASLHPRACTYMQLACKHAKLYHTRVATQRRHAICEVLHTTINGLLIT